MNDLRSEVSGIRKEKLNVLLKEEHFYCRKCKNYYPISRLHLRNKDLYCDGCLKKM